MNFILKGNIYYSKSYVDLQMHENSYIICKDGKTVGIFTEIPDKYKDLRVIDYTDKTIVPGLVDLHVHASQYAIRGIDMDCKLIQWLKKEAFAEETRFSNTKYAEKAYACFVSKMRSTATTRASILATRHKDTTLMLMDMLESAGLSAYVGKVNMDRNAPKDLIEKDSVMAAKDTVAWLDECKHFKNIKPILTPRFLPSCTDDLMNKLQTIQEKYALPLQSHLSENLQEIEWVKALYPKSKFYGDAYNSFKLFGGNVPTVMAHCVHSCDKEVELIKKKNVFVAHCPQSNTNLASGIAPIKHYLKKHLKVALGSDVGAGTSLSIFRAMVDAIEVSKLRCSLLGSSNHALTIKEVFYLGTKGGGEFFGKVGSFEPDYEFDAIVIDDEQMEHPRKMNLFQRLERIIYLSSSKHIIAKFVKGKKLF